MRNIILALCLFLLTSFNALSMLKVKGDNNKTQQNLSAPIIQSLSSEEDENWNKVIKFSNFSWDLILRKHQMTQEIKDEFEKLANEVLGAYGNMDKVNSEYVHKAMNNEMNNLPQTYFLDKIP